MADETAQTAESTTATTEPTNTELAAKVDALTVKVEAFLNEVGGAYAKLEAHLRGSGCRFR
ncbi:hypothetical protein [Xanthobacter sp. ZOL 2024]